MTSACARNLHAGTLSLHVLAATIINEAAHLSRFSEEPAPSL